jgi:hypothetical protein
MLIFSCIVLFVNVDDVMRILQSDKWQLTQISLTAANPGMDTQNIFR